MRLEGRVAAVTGGSRSIGRGIVEAFLRERIGFTDIGACVEAALERILAPTCRSLDDVLAVDQATRRFVDVRVSALER